MESDSVKTKDKIKLLLSNHLGIEPEDIDDDSILAEDFHMKPNDLTDFMETLSANGFATEGIDLAEIETFDDLYNSLVD